MLVFSLFIFLQIVAESFPISSSGHIVVALELLKKWDYQVYNIVSALMQRSDVLFAIHLPTVFIIILFYAPRWVPFFYKLPEHVGLFLRIVGYVAMANGVTAICYGVINYCALTISLWLGFMITFLLLIATYGRLKSCLRLELRHFLFLGVVQGVAVLPGISRLAAVYAMGRMFGLSGKKAFDVAWMLQLPLIAAAACFGWSALYYRDEMDLLVSKTALMAIGIGSVVAFMGFYAMDRLAKTDNLWRMAWYILIPLLLSLWYNA